MQIGNIIIEPWNRKNTFWRLLVLGIVGAWLGWGFVLYLDGQEIKARIQEHQLEQARRAEIRSHQAAYERALEEQRRQRTGVRNVIDEL